jgi:hypothetical protein
LGETVYEKFDAEFDVPKIFEYEEKTIEPSSIIFSRIISLGDQYFLKIH